jgi:hypothetical protein
MFSSRDKKKHKGTKTRIFGFYLVQKLTKMIFKQCIANYICQQPKSILKNRYTLIHTFSHLKVSQLEMNILPSNSTTES